MLSLLDKKENYVVGVSGGCDSMALLDMMVKENYHVYVCHVNYHLRNDSDLDQKTVSNYCQEHQLPCFVKEIDACNYGKENFQSQARMIRYRFYQEIADKYQAKVVLAHHQDDVLENIVMQLERHNTKGYLGIKPISHVFAITVYRPLLAEHKATLREYCHQNNVAYRDDYTNFQTEFTRDYVRNVTLKQYSLEQREDLLKQANEHNKRYIDKVKQLEPYLLMYQKQQYIDYQLIPGELLEAFIYEIVKREVYPPLISDALVKEIIKQIKSNKPNITMNLPVNTRFIKEYDNVYVSKANNDQEYCLKYSKLVYDKHEYYYLSNTGHINEGIYLTKEDFPITIRSSQLGDVIKTTGGTKKLSRLFIDNKVPKNKRQTWPVVENSQGEIVLVPHLAKNIRYLYSKPNLYVLKL